MKPCSLFFFLVLSLTFSSSIFSMGTNESRDNQNDQQQIGKFQDSQRFALVFYLLGSSSFFSACLFLIRSFLSCSARLALSFVIVMVVFVYVQGFDASCKWRKGQTETAKRQTSPTFSISSLSSSCCCLVCSWSFSSSICSQSVCWWNGYI